MTQAFGLLPRPLGFSLFAGLLLLFGGCAGSGGGGTGADTRVTVSMATAPRVGALAAVPADSGPVPRSVRDVRLTVSGSDMADVVASSTVQGEEPVSLTVAVPPGPARTFEVEARDGLGVVRYQGATTVDVFGERLDVAVRLGVAATNPAPGRWRWRNPTPTGADLAAAAFGDDTFVVVGAAGTLLTSTDHGATWSPGYAEAGEDLRGVAFGDGTFAAVGGEGGVFISRDRGATWASAARADAGLTDVVFGSGRFLAVGSGPSVLVSADAGATWALADPDLPADGEPSALAFGDGEFSLLVGQSSLESSTVYRSLDGSAWTSAGVAVAYGSAGLAFGNGMLLVADRFGQIVVVPPASEPISYAITDGTDLFRACFGDGEFFAVGDRGFVSGSTDPAAPTNQGWSARSQETGAALRGCAYGAGTLVAVGDGGAVVTYSGEVGQGRWSTLFPLPDGGPGPAVQAVGFGEGVFVAAAGGRGIVRSPDGGESWVPATVGGTSPAAVQRFAYGGGTFLGLGAYSAYASTDAGVTWSDESRGAVGSPEALVYGDGTFRAAFESGQVFRGSAPAVAGSGWTWTAENLPAGILARAIAYGAGVWVAVGARASATQDVVVSAAAVSSDGGQTWEAVAEPGSGPLEHVVFGPAAFVAVDAAGRSYRSPDGRTWSPDGVIPLNDSTVSGLAYGGGALLASDDRGFLYASLDGGATWASAGFRSPLPLRSLTFGDGTFVAGGDAGALLQSEPL